MLTFFGIPLMVVGISLLLLNEHESMTVSILTAIGSLSLSVAIHQVVIYPLTQVDPTPTPPLLLMNTTDLAAFIVSGILLLAIGIVAHLKTGNLSVKHNTSPDRTL